jgi:hypothetical protein
MPQPQLKPIEERDPYAAMVLDAFDRTESAMPKNCVCDCKDSAIRRVDSDHPHPAIAREGWFCMGCLTEYIPAKIHGHTCSEMYDEQQAHVLTKGRLLQMQHALERLVDAESTGNHGQDLACVREIARMGLSWRNA